MVSNRRAEIAMVAVAVLLVLLGIICTPETLVRMEIMENALNSPSELIRRGATFEIEAARVLAFVLAAGLFVLTPFLSRIRNSERYRAFVAQETPGIAESRAFRARIWTPSFWVVLTGVALVHLYIVTGDKVFSPHQLRLINREDGGLETISALMNLAAAMISVRTAIQIGRGGRGFRMHVFFGILFFLMFGEEISWGQRYLGLVTPESIAAINVQAEMNFHNMYGYVFDHMFVLCFLLWGSAVPLLDRFSPFFRQVFARIALPVPSAGLAIGMVLVSMMQTVIVYKFIDPLPTLRLQEARELLSALSFFVLMQEAWVLALRRAPAERAAAQVRSNGRALL